MIPFSSLASRSFGRGKSRRQANRGLSQSLQVEALEGRRLLSTLQVMPLTFPPDGLHYHTLQAALTAASAGDTIQIEPNADAGFFTSSTLVNATTAGDRSILTPDYIDPGEVVTLGTDRVLVDSATPAAGGNFRLTLHTPLAATHAAGDAVTNAHAIGITKAVTIQGDIGALESVAPALEVESGTNNVTIQNLVLNGVVLDTGSFHTQLLDCQIAAVSETGTGAGNGSNLINGNTIGGPVSLTGNDAGTATGDVITNNQFTGPGAILNLTHDDSAFVQGNNFLGDAPKLEAAITVTSSQNASVLNNKIDLTGEFLLGIRVQDSASAAATVAVKSNSVTTSGLGVGLDFVTGNPASAVAAQGNDLRGNFIGVLAFGNGTQAGTIDLGGGRLGSLGGNDFKGFAPSATANGGFAVYFAGAPSNALTARDNIWSVMDPSTVVKDGSRNIQVGGGADGTGSIDLGAHQLTVNEQYVQTLYNEFLGRTGTLTELDGWANLGATGFAAVANGILRAPESLRHIVDGFYLKFLNRAADAGGEAGWVHFLQTGGTEEQVISGFLSSPEYFNHAYALDSLTSPETSFVQSLYVQLLGRPGSATEVDGWLTGMVTSGRSGVINGILGSMEYRNNEVSYDFTHLLHRTALPAQSLITAFANQGMDRLALDILFAGTSEFVANG
jgi:hypothetical protein